MQRVSIAGANAQARDQTAQPGSLAFSALGEGDVSAEDVFFHKYFTMERVTARRAEAARKKAVKRKRKKGEDDEDDLGDVGESEGSEEDDSAAEDDFLEGLEAMEVRYCS
jgi:hypothetical protein